MKHVYTVGAVAAVCGVCGNTARRWCDSGLLKHHRTPNGHRRVSRAALEAFLKKHDMPFLGRLDLDLKKRA